MELWSKNHKKLHIPHPPPLKIVTTSLLKPQGSHGACFGCCCCDHGHYGGHFVSDSIVELSSSIKSKEYLKQLYLF
jgi:hypothetical protein